MNGQRHLRTASSLNSTAIYHLACALSFRANILKAPTERNMIAWGEAPGMQGKWHKAQRAEIFN
jgi:hypothetical protein